MVRNIKHACLVNIITKKDYVEELLMFKATPKNIAFSINNILDNIEAKERILEGCRLTKELLGNTHCTENVAKIIKDELTKN